jgi:hypothetical protein
MLFKPHVRLHRGVGLGKLANREYTCSRSHAEVACNDFWQNEELDVPMHVFME